MRSRLVFALVSVLGSLVVVASPPAGAETELLVGRFATPRFDGAAAFAGADAWHFGGATGTGGETAEIYYANLGRAGLAAYLPYAVRGAAAVAHRGLIYVVGGRSGSLRRSSIVAFDPRTKSAGVAAFALPKGVEWPAVASDGERIYVFGGMTVDGPTTDAYEIDTVSGAVTELPPLPRALYAARATFDGLGVLITGGGPGVWISMSWRFVPRSRSYEEIPGSAASLAAVVFDGISTLDLGGRTSTGELVIFDSVRRRNPITGSTTTGRSLAAPVHSHAAAYTGREVILFGGLGPNGPRDDIIAYDPIVTDRCANEGAVVAGLVGNGLASIGVAASEGDIVVCARVDQSHMSHGLRITLEGPLDSLNLADSKPCEASLAAPLVIGDPGDPAGQTVITAGSDTNNGHCVSIVNSSGLGEPIRVRVAGGQTMSVDFERRAVAPLPIRPAGSASNTCIYSAAHTSVGLDAWSAGSRAFLVLVGNSAKLGTADLCARIESGEQGVGGRFSFDRPYANPSLSATTFPDPACPRLVASLGLVRLYRSDDGQPAAVCTSSPAGDYRLSTGVIATWTPDE